MSSAFSMWRRLESSERRKETRLTLLLVLLPSSFVSVVSSIIRPSELIFALDHDYDDLGDWRIEEDRKLQVSSSKMGSKTRATRLLTISSSISAPLRPVCSSSRVVEGILRDGIGSELVLNSRSTGGELERNEERGRERKVSLDFRGNAGRPVQMRREAKLTASVSCPAYMASESSVRVTLLA